MREKIVSCGIILCTPDGWLIAHSTGNKHWDFPKGIAAAGEPHYVAALRELREETGFIFDDESPHVVIKDLGQHPYIGRKELHLYWVGFNARLDPKLFECTSMVERPNYSFPEVDDFKFVRPTEAAPMLAKSMQEWVRTYVPAELKE